MGDAPLTLAYCWAHSRRKLHDICQKDGSKIAAKGLRRIAQLYKIEASVRGRPPEERLAAHQAQSAPLIADFRLWLTQQRSRISAKSRLGEKLPVTSRKVIWLFPEQLWLEFVPVLHRLQGYLAAESRLRKLLIV